MKIDLYTRQNTLTKDNSPIKRKFGELNNDWKLKNGLLKKLKVFENLI